MKEFYPFKINKLHKKLYDKICNLVNEKFNLQVENINSICDENNNKPKAYKISIKNSQSIRLDIKHQESVTHLQILVNKYDIEIPKILGVFGKYKFSEWIDGVMLLRVTDVPEVFIASGEMMARLNLIEIQNKFVSNDEFSLSNAIWTKDKKVYLIDQGRMKLFENTDDSIARILMKRIKDKTNIFLFLKGYSKYKNTIHIENILKKYDYKWSNYVSK